MMIRYVVEEFRPRKKERKKHIIIWDFKYFIIIIIIHIIIINAGSLYPLRPVHLDLQSIPILCIFVFV